MGAAKAAIADMQRAWGEAGGDPAARVATAFTGGCVLKDGEAWDSPRARAQAGPHATVALHNGVEVAEFGNMGRSVPPALVPSWSATARSPKSSRRSEILSNHAGTSFLGRRSRRSAPRICPHVTPRHAARVARAPGRYALPLPPLRDQSVTEPKADVGLLVSGVSGSRTCHPRHAAVVAVCRPAAHFAGVMRLLSRNKAARAVLTCPQRCGCPGPDSHEPSCASLM